MGAVRTTTTADGCCAERRGVVISALRGPSGPFASLSVKIPQTANPHPLPRRALGVNRRAKLSGGAPVWMPRSAVGRKYLTDADACRLSITLCFTAQPVDRLWHQIQHQDHKACMLCRVAACPTQSGFGDSMTPVMACIRDLRCRPLLRHNIRQGTSVQLALSADSPFLVCIRHLTSAFKGVPSDGTSLYSLFHHASFGDNAETRTAFVSMVRLISRPHNVHGGAHHSGAHVPTLFL